MACFDVRAVQIDLARQIETTEMVKSFFDVCADAGMNMVVMYLEDRIKTECYPYSHDKESYSKEEIKELVSYAEGLGLELVPVVSPIGHTERFMRHSELKPLAELYKGLAGAFNKAGEEVYLATCPSRKETLEFFDAYITEVAELFPGRYFHIGFDEIWDMGFCDACKDKKLEELYLNAVVHFHDLLKGLGKETMIWDDMIEEFPWIIDKLPKDIVMCAWFYDYVGRYPIARFSTGRSFDIFKQFEEKGFRYLACPWQRGSLDSLTTYASKYRPMGMFLTNWEMSDHQQIPCLFPTITYAGLIWTGKEKPGMDAVIKAAEKYTDDYDSAVALATLMTAVTYRSYPLPGENASYHIPSESSYYNACMMPIVENCAKNIKGDHKVITSFTTRFQYYKLRYQLWDAGYKLHEYRSGEGTCSLCSIMEQVSSVEMELDAFEKAALDFWNECRPGFDNPDLMNNINNARNSVAWMKKTCEEAKENDHGRLVVRFTVLEYTTACKTGIVLHYADGSEYQVACGGYKSINIPNFVDQFDVSFRIPADKDPVAVTLSVSGYGGSGFRYVSATLPGRIHFIPDGIIQVKGQVEHPEYILYEDTRTSMFNEQEMLQYFASDISPRREHSVTVSLKKW